MIFGRKVTFSMKYSVFLSQSYISCIVDAFFTTFGRKVVFSSSFSVVHTSFERNVVFSLMFGYISYNFWSNSCIFIDFWSISNNFLLKSSISIDFGSISSDCWPKSCRRCVERLIFVNFWSISDDFWSKSCIVIAFWCISENVGWVVGVCNCITSFFTCHCLPSEAWMPQLNLIRLNLLKQNHSEVGTWSLMKVTPSQASWNVWRSPKRRWSPFGVVHWFMMPWWGEFTQLEEVEADFGPLGWDQLEVNLGQLEASLGPGPTWGHSRPTWGQREPTSANLS